MGLAVARSVAATSVVKAFHGQQSTAGHPQQQVFPAHLPRGKKLS